MSNAQKKTVRTVSEIEAAIAAGQPVTKDEQRRVDEHNASQIATVQVTAETIHASIVASMGSLAAAFYEPEQRVLADNGKAYPHDASLPDGVQDTGEVIDVNRFWFMQRDYCGALCWVFENRLEKADERISGQRARIMQMTRQLSTGTVTESQIERLADFLETLIEQRAMAEVAYFAALEAYEVAVGEQYETKALRAERERTMRSRPKTDLDARLARLGVNA